MLCTTQEDNASFGLAGPDGVPPQPLSTVMRIPAAASPEARTLRAGGRLSSLRSLGRPAIGARLSHVAWLSPVALVGP